MKEFFAHSVEGKPKSEWQGLEEHLLNAEGTVPDLRAILWGQTPKLTFRKRAADAGRKRETALIG